MAEHSSIEWTDATWNPVRGCTKISPGCKHCYAETFAERFRGVPGHPYERGFDLRLVPEKLSEPLRWARSRMIFVNSMSDLFHDAARELAHLSGPDETRGQDGHYAADESSGTCEASPHLVGS
jgi:protein gp37